MANDLISRKALIADLRTAKGLGLIIAETIVRFLKKQPTVDAVEVVRGRWECENESWGAIRCSNCNGKALLEELNGERLYVFSDYCPNCGAVMRGTEE